MAILDYVILIALACGFIIGFCKGAVKQAFSLGGLILGIILGKFLYKPFAGFLQNAISMSDRTAQIVGFIVILIVVPILAGLLGKLLSKVIRAANLGFVDRILGGVLGFFIWLIVMGLTFQLLDMGGLTDAIADGSKESKLYMPVRKTTQACLSWTWKKVLETGEDLLPDFSDGSDDKMI